MYADSSSSTNLQHTRIHKIHHSTKNLYSIMENHLVYRTLVDYYRGEDEDWFNELGFHTNPMKAYLYTVAILHDTVLLLGTQQHLLRGGNSAASRTAMYLQRFDRQTRIIRDTVVQDAINFFGRENIRRAIAKEEDTPIELMHMDAEDISNITNSLRGLFL